MSSNEIAREGEPAIAPPPGSEVAVTVLPTCDFCRTLLGDGSVPAMYDFKTRMGPWAHGCVDHWHAYRMYPTLGTGKGQRLVVNP
jgi:hypothetical protein